MYIYIYIHIYIYINIYIYIYTIYIYIYVCLHVCIYVCMYVCMYVCVYCTYIRTVLLSRKKTHFRSHQTSSDIWTFQYPIPRRTIDLTLVASRGHLLHTVKQFKVAVT